MKIQILPFTLDLEPIEQKVDNISDYQNEAQNYLHHISKDEYDKVKGNQLYEDDNNILYSPMIRQYNYYMVEFHVMNTIYDKILPE